MSQVLSRFIRFTPRTCRWLLWLIRWRRRLAAPLLGERRAIVMALKDLGRVGELLLLVELEEEPREDHP